MKNVVIVSHKFLTQPDDDLCAFLNEKEYNNVLFIRHSFSEAKDRKSWFSWHKKGRLFKEGASKDFQGMNDLFIYIKESFFTLKWVFKSKTKWDFYIGMDGLCAFWGNVLRAFGKVEKTVFWAIDFVPQRFKSKLANRVYHFVNGLSYKMSNQMWDLSPRMKQARKDFMNISESLYRLHKVVPYGAWTDKIKRYDFQDCQKNTLVFMGHLLEKQGVQFIIKALPEIIKTIPDFEFKIIGAGKYKEELLRQSQDLGVGRYCRFLGKVDKYSVLEDEIAKSCLAVAPYIKTLDTWTYYADPGKVKTYLSCGVPVLLTDIPWNAREIKEQKCGAIIKEDQEDIVSKIISFMDPEVNQEYRLNARKYAESFNYQNIFNNLLD